MVLASGSPARPPAKICLNCRASLASSCSCKERRSNPPVISRKDLNRAIFGRNFASAGRSFNLQRVILIRKLNDSQLTVITRQNKPKLFQTVVSDFPHVQHLNFASRNLFLDRKSVV